MFLLHESHNLPGRLIVVEGIDGSGKSTQAMLLQKWLISCGVSTVFTEWNSSLLVKSTTKAAKKRNALTPTTFSLLHATDFADRLTYQIIPPLKGGMVVIADRYAFTAFARDVARGVDPQWVRGIYGFALKPDVTFYFRVPIEVSLERLLSARAAIKFYEAGMDVTSIADPIESFQIFQGRVLRHYDEMSAEFDFTVIDASRAIDVQQHQVRKVVADLLQDYFLRHKITLPLVEPFALSV